MFPTHANGFWAPKMAVWIVGSLVLATSPFWQTPSRQSVPNRCLGWFVAWVVLSFGYLVLWPQLIVPQQSQAVFALPWNVWPILPTLACIGSLFVLDALIRQTDYVERWNHVALHLIRIGSVLGIWAIAQRLGLDPVGFVAAQGIVSKTSAITTFGNSTVTGNFLAILAPLALMFRARKYRYGAWALISAGVLVCNSTSSLLAWAAGTLLVLVLHRKYVSSLILAGAIFLAGIIGMRYGLVPTNALDLGGRWEVWTTAIHFLRTHPLYAWIGAGAGSVGYLTTTRFWTYGYLHNTLLDLVFCFGLIGAGLALGACRSLLRRIWQTPRTASGSAWMGAALAYLLVASVNFPLELGSFLMVGVLIWAALVVHTQEGVHV